TYTDAKNGQLMQGMMGPSIESLDDAIEHGNSKKFQTALEQTVSTCNACHTATGSSFIQVTLDAQESISLRHPHTFAERGIPGGHTHDMPDQSQPMMEQMEGMMVEMHNDSDQPEHND
ncbi:MAG: hypothetical protein OER96_08880, partial [Gammaproteobacteria bacterium]|nr:hypothetical protein [Gammaproteobacteria bacterium]